MTRRLVRPTGLLAQNAALKTERDNALAKLESARSETLAYREIVGATSHVAKTYRAKLAAVDALHQHDGHACTCGTTWPCPTRRALDKEDDQ